MALERTAVDSANGRVVAVVVIDGLSGRTKADTDADPASSAAIIFVAEKNIFRDWIKTLW